MVYVAPSHEGKRGTCNMVPSAAHVSTEQVLRNWNYADPALRIGATISAGGSHVS
jgi:hypothetical protein